MYRTKNLEIFVDLSTLCNAGCPQCHRTSVNGLGKQDWLPMVQWSFQEFKSAFPSELLKNNVSAMSICGTWGDPVMNKDIKEIIAYVVEQNPNVFINLDTNGSIRDEQWWWELGMLAGKSLRVIFAVDGIDQAMHAKYRRFTDLQKVLSNMQAISETKSQVEGHTILFKHNQDHIEKIKKLCIDNGAGAYRVTQSDRFDNEDSTEGKYFHFTNEKGQKETLQITDYDPPNGFVAHTNKNSLDKKIVCRWQLVNRVLVNIDGQVLPCCYLVNTYYKNKFAMHNKKFSNHPVMQAYIDEENNIFKHPLLQIIQHSKWFNKTLPNSWNTDNPVAQCSKQCSTMTKTKHQLKAYL